VCACLGGGGEGGGWRARLAGRAPHCGTCTGVCARSTCTAPPARPHVLACPAAHTRAHTRATRISGTRPPSGSTGACTALCSAQAASCHVPVVAIAIVATASLWHAAAYGTQQHMAHSGTWLMHGAWQQARKPHIDLLSAACAAVCVCVCVCVRVCARARVCLAARTRRKLWNRPVHTWLLRTVYFPAMRAGASRCGPRTSTRVCAPRTGLVPQRTAAPSVSGTECCVSTRPHAPAARLPAAGLRPWCWCSL
jgi:hypothetical protein